MTIGEWLAAREREAPAPLGARIRDLLGDAAERDAAELAETCLRAAEERLARLLEEDPTRREAAFELLAVDALVTYALEAATDDLPTLEARTRDAMGRVAALPAIRSA